MIQKIRSELSNYTIYFTLGSWSSILCQLIVNFDRNVSSRKGLPRFLADREWNFRSNSYQAVKNNFNFVCFHDELSRNRQKSCFLDFPSSMQLLLSCIFEFCCNIVIPQDIWKIAKQAKWNRQEEPFVYTKIRENLCPENDLWNQDLTLSAKHPLQSDRLIWVGFKFKRDYMDYTNTPDNSSRIFYYKNHI